MKTQKAKPTWDNLTPNDIWEIYLTEGYPGLIKRAPTFMRPRMFAESGIFRILPADPRCAWCKAPFHGFGAPIMKVIGKGQSKLNPSLCSDCEEFVVKHEGGAEVDAALLFIDIRGSTTLAESMRPTEFGDLIDRFYTTVTDIIVDKNGFVEKLVGDEVTAFFVSGLAGRDYAKVATETAKEVLAITGHGSVEGPWVPLGAGIHSGRTFIGVVGAAQGLNEISVLGDTANTAARLAAEAKVGEILVSEVAANLAGLQDKGAETRTLQLKGKGEALKVRVLRSSPEPATA